MLLTAAILHQHHVAERFAVKGHEKILAEKEIQLARGKLPVLAAVVHAVNDHEQIWREPILLLGRIFLHLRRRTDRDAILDGQRMEVEHALQDCLHFLRRRSFEVNP